VTADRSHSGVHRLAVVGVGMMGGSLALAARTRAKVDEVVGFDSDPSTSEEALAHGIVTEVASSAAEAAAYADLVVVSTPVRSIPAIVEECAASEPQPRLICDMGSTKSAIMRSLSPKAHSLFIGGHPLCGAADSGLKYARADLFEGATYFLCTTGDGFPKLYAMLQQFVADLGARPTHIEPDAHDQIMAVVSHLPHVLANALMDHAGAFNAGGKRALQWVGASFTDLTRVAGANPTMWRDVFLENSEALTMSLHSLCAGLQEFSEHLAAGDATAVSKAIESAAAYREEMLEFADITPGTLYKVTVRVPDEPGVIARVMTALGRAEINVEDLTLHHMSRSVGGDLELFVAGEDVAGRAATLLNSLGYPSRVGTSGDGAD
jgi:prephenate dehydrogenase